MLNTLMKNRRSIRKFQEKPVPRELVEELLGAALLAPSSFGHNPVEFLVVDDRDDIARVIACKNMGAKPLETAPVAVIVLCDRTRGEFWVEDAAIAGSYFLLKAEEMGLGACWVHLRKRSGQEKTSEEEIQELFQIPERYGVLCVFALGYQAEEKAPRSQVDMGKIHFNEF